MKKIDYIFDGAMSTYYNSLKNTYTSSELCNISDASLIQNIHNEYIQAGANAIKTNTFGLNTNLVTDIKKRNELIKAGIDNAMVFKDKATVFGDIGPINIKDENDHEYLDIVKIFLDNGIKHFLFETLLDFEPLISTLEYLKTIEDTFIIVSFAVDQDGYTQTGNYYKTLFKQASKYADVVGLNCIIGPHNMEKLINRLPENDYKISIMPNAGYVYDYYDEILINQNIAYFSDIFTKIVSKGVSVIGGCCYTTPHYIKAMVDKVEIIAPDAFNNVHELFEIKDNKSKLKRLFSEGIKVIAAEIEPPCDTETKHLEQSIQQFSEAGADMMTLVDSPLARTRADSMLISAKVANDVSCVMPHLTCRDRNQIALKSSLIGANMFGVNTVLALSGDGIAKIDRDFTKGVFDFNSFNLINFIKELNNDIFKNNPFYIGAALNVNVQNFDVEIARAKRKMEKGANFFVTQSLFSQSAITNLIKARKELSLPIIVNIYPVASYRNALFLHNEVKGIEISSQLLSDLEKADKSEYFKISTDHCKRTIDKVYNYCDGFVISTPLKKTEYALELVRYLKKKRSEQ